MNLLDLIPSLRRQIRQYVKADDTDSILAGYVADAIDALNWRWNRSYVITFINPNTYTVSPDITARDVRPIVLMAGIIYKMGRISIASWKDGDFAWDPVKLRLDPLTHDLEELKDILPSYPQLAPAISSPLRGYSYIFNPENPDYLNSFYFLLNYI